MVKIDNFFEEKIFQTTDWGVKLEEINEKEVKIRVSHGAASLGSNADKDELEQLANWMIDILSKWK